MSIYSDEGISGCSIRKRKGFQAMIAACEAGQIDLVITKSISRFAQEESRSISEITAGGPILYEIPELTQAVLQEGWLGDDGTVRFQFLVGKID